MDRIPKMSCEIANYGEFAPADFDSISCAACFYFIYMLSSTYGNTYQSAICGTSGILICPIGAQDCHCNNPRYVYNDVNYAINRSSITPLAQLQLSPPLPVEFLEVTRECCLAAEECCNNTLHPHSIRHSKNSKRGIKKVETLETCGPVWDGWKCFEPAEQHSNVSFSCPSYIYGEDRGLDYSNKIAVKRCTADGWMKINGRAYTDYGGCMEHQGIEARLLAGIITYTISVIVVVPAVLLLAFVRPMCDQPMFILHKHLLISFLLYGALYLLNVGLFVVQNAPLSNYVYSNHIFCSILFSAQLRFLRLSNFSWMLAEGFYLYRLLYKTNQTEGESLRKYKIICWGVPAVLACFYMFVRSIYDQGMCWIENLAVAWVEWIIILPSLLAMTVNVFLLTLVMYILVKKLRCDPHLERIQYRKAVRGALMLMPVFGIQQLLTIYRLQNTVYQAIDLSLNGLQGMFVALIVCYTNKTVSDSIRKIYTSHKETRAFVSECRQRHSVQEHKILLKKSNNNTEA